MLTLSGPVERAPQAPTADGGLRTLNAGEILFRQGEPRLHVYRVETGSVCLFTEREDGRQAVIEFAFPGDFVGLGYLDSHVSGAQAAMDCSLTCMPRAAVEPLLLKSPAGTSRLGAAIDREVAFLNEAQRQPVAEPLGRIAALFVTLARCNAYEGRDPTVITDSLTCGLVAGYLNMSVDELSHWLGELKNRDLVEACASGLRLKNLHEFERLADTVD